MLMNEEKAKAAEFRLNKAETFPRNLKSNYYCRLLEFGEDHWDESYLLRKMVLKPYKIKKGADPFHSSFFYGGPRSRAAGSRQSFFWAGHLIKNRQGPPAQKELHIGRCPCLYPCPENPC
ncbi:hypothetical protein PEDI_40670 [Persicobacter diffluens]|uniref:Uncharacterized protein n=1 Tax=Persicobacter diffluens TaxID=981 RepID=A0AAN4W3V9_9BACT|nr:hypothetical protein PEDI_40670 [Persicobacter diffluens]